MKSKTAVKSSNELEAFKQIPSFILCKSWKFKSPARKQKVDLENIISGEYWPQKQSWGLFSEIWDCSKDGINESRSFAKLQNCMKYMQLTWPFHHVFFKIDLCKNLNVICHPRWLSTWHWSENKKISCLFSD